MKSLSRPSRRLKIFGGILIGLLIGFMVWYSRVEWIPAGHVGLIYNANSGIVRKVIEPRAMFVGFFSQLYIYPTKVQAAIYSQDSKWGEQRTADGIQITTSDSAITTFDVTVIYRVKPEHVFTVFDKFGPISIEEIQTLHIRRAVREAASAIGNRYDVFELLGPKRQEASQAMTVELQRRLHERGITIIAAMLGTAYPSQSIADKITQRVNAYTQLEISKLESQIAEINRQAAIIKGAAETEARTLTALQTQDKSVEMLKLELEAEAIEKWKQGGGQLPNIIVRPGQNVIINGSGATVIPGGR
jgi:hypothetical protein